VNLTSGPVLSLTSARVQAAEEQAKVLEDDPTAYDYDELYDNLKQTDVTRKSILEEEKKKRQVRVPRRPVVRPAD
jgi:hypothetical protein